MQLALNKCSQLIDNITWYLYCLHCPTLYLAYVIWLFFVQRQQNQEEHEPLSSAYDGSSPASAIVAVDTNLDTSTSDTYRAPPAPLPYDVSLPVPENPGKLTTFEPVNMRNGINLKW